MPRRMRDGRLRNDDAPVLELEMKCNNPQHRARISAKTRMWNDAEIDDW